MDHKTPYQRYCIRHLELALNDKETRTILTTPGIKQSILHMIRHYPEIAKDNKTTYQKGNSYKEYFKITERAANALDKENNHKVVYSEHIYLVIQVFNELVELTKDKNDKIITKDEIETILNKLEIIILSKEEANVLNGRKDKLFSLDGIQVSGKGLKTIGDYESRLDAIGAKIDLRYKDNKLV